MSIVTIQGNGFCGKIFFEDAEKAFEFYFEQCKDDRFTLINHNDIVYDACNLLNELRDIEKGN